MYILCYLFDNDELSVEELKNATEETAQYSLHAVGLVMHRDSRRLFVADPNGALIGGSNKEFLAMPLKKLNHTSTTKVSAYDRSVMKRLNTTLFIAKPNGEIFIEKPAKKRANSNTDQVSCKRRSSCYGYFFLNQINKKTVSFPIILLILFFLLFPYELMLINYRQCLFFMLSPSLPPS